MPGCRQSKGLRTHHVRAALAAGVLTGFAAAALWPAAVRAQAAPSDASQAGPLQEIIVTATRRAESLSKVPISVTALTQEALDLRGIKDFTDVAKFTPGVEVDDSGTNNISIRGIASTGGAGTTGIYIDDTPIQMRALAFNPDETLPEAFDIQRVEVLRGPQGTLFGAGSEGGTVRYITVQPSLTKSSIYSRDEVSYTQGGEPSYEVGVAGGTPIIPGTLGVRATVWYRRDGGWIDLIDPVSLATVRKNANSADTYLVRLAAVWAINDRWQATPSFYYQNKETDNTSDYWSIYSNPSQDRYFSADPDRRPRPDRFYLPSLKLEGDLGSVKLISNTSYYHRTESSGYEGTLYNLGFYQSGAVFASVASGYPLLLDGSGVHLPPGATDYRSPASVDNGQQNFVEELRLQSNDPSSALTWTTGLFYSSDRQTYIEQIHDPLLNELTQNYSTATTYDQIFCVYDAVAGACANPYQPVLYDPRFPNDSYFLQTHARDEQIAWYGEATYAFTDQWKLTVGARESHTKYTFDTLTGGPQLYLPPQTGTGGKTENAFTPKLSLAYQYDDHNLYYATYAKGFRPGGANNPVPYAACATDFQNFGINQAPQTFSSDTVNSYELGAKNNFDNRVKIASSIYYIKWNNIQQTVVPPVCQISFISNLGSAVAKGADIQADIAVTDHFSAQLTAGYTDARYTRTAVFSPAEVTPIVTSGDAITGQSGQPGAPVTASAGLEYNFSLWNHDSFVRFDDEYQGRAKWLSPQQDPSTQQYDSANYVLSPTNLMSMRAGTSFGGWQVAAFVDNLADSRTITNYRWSIDPGGGNSRLQRQFTYRPRTIGLSFTYRD